jgi:hypothetical protein
MPKGYRIYILLIIRHLLLIRLTAFSIPRKHNPKMGMGGLPGIYFVKLNIDYIKKRIFGYNKYHRRYNFDQTH